MIVQDGALWQEVYSSREEYERAVREACGYVATYDPDLSLSRALIGHESCMQRNAATQARKLVLEVGRRVGWSGDRRDLLNLVIDYTHGRVSACDLAICPRDIILRCQEQLATLERCVNWRSYVYCQEKTKRSPCPCSRIP